jgi:hypothetical protein
LRGADLIIVPGLGTASVDELVSAGAIIPH